MNKNIDWNEVEKKISIICYRFSNLEYCRDDLAQELRMHAYYVSDNYYDLYRKAIDFWRKIQSSQAPEVPYIDLEAQEIPCEDHTGMYLFDELVALIMKELDRPGYNKWDKDMLDLSKKLLTIMISDIDERKKPVESYSSSSTKHYINQRLNLSWVAEETGINYKRIVVAMKFLEDTVRGLAAMKKIEIPKEYFEGYYD